MIIRLLIGILLIASPSWAGYGMQVVAATSGGGGCGAGVLFEWHCEDADVMAATPTPAGCVADGADSTATTTPAAALSPDHTPYDGTNACYFPTAGDRFAFTVASDKPISSAAGTAVFYLKIHTFATTYGIFYGYADGSNSFRALLSGTDDATGRELQFIYTGNGTNRAIATTNSDLALETWYKITVKWSTTAVSSNYLYLQVDSATPVVGTTAINAFTTALGTDGLVFGDRGGAAGAVSVDNIKVYNSWLP